jgi:serine/threonine protein kinase
VSCAYTACDLWTFGVCAHHWSTGTIPFYSPEGEDETNAMTLKGEYDKTVPQLSKSSRPGDENGLHRTGLLSLCEALLVIDPNARLGYGSTGYAAIKHHNFFDGFDWNALAVGALPPPIKPKPKQIHADLPTSLKDEFGHWAMKDVPAEAEESFRVDEREQGYRRDDGRRVSQPQPRLL